MIVWVMENEELGITSMASDYEECKKRFNEEFFLLWKEYGKANDSDLIPDAKILKSKILQYLEPQTT